jgi:uncharacterized membrane protein YqjE
MSASQRSSADEGVLDLLAAMAATRLELAASDIEAHLGVTAASVAFAVAAFVLALVALVFAGVVVIALFWDTHRVVASLATLLGYVAIALAFVARARSRWRARPPAFAATLRELELDREAVREVA